MNGNVQERYFYKYLFEEAYNDHVVRETLTTDLNVDKYHIYQTSGYECHNACDALEDCVAFTSPLTIENDITDDRLSYCYMSFKGENLTYGRVTGGFAGESRSQWTSIPDA